jgi:hypothetical protein
MGRLWVITKKIFSVSLVFNALLTITFATNILSTFYWHSINWHPFSPYLINGNLFWIAIVAAVINIFPSASLGRSLHTGRFLFHHYIYGFIVLACALAYVILFSPVGLSELFFVFDQRVEVNIGRFFVLGGLALILDDLPDVSTRIESALNRLKFKVGEINKVVSILHVVCGTVSLYIFAAIALSMTTTPQEVTLANILCAGTIFITGVTSFIFVKRGIWQKINHQKPKQTLVNPSAITNFIYKPIISKTTGAN